jgi:hypothetical protein
VSSPARSLGLRRDSFSSRARAAPDHDGYVEPARVGFLRPPDAHEPSPDGEPDLLKLCDVAHRHVHEHPGRAPGLRLEDYESSPTAPFGAGSGMVITNHLPRPDRGQGLVYRQVVALAAQDSARGPCCAGSPA